jgi:hypothetical protein
MDTRPMIRCPCQRDQYKEVPNNDVLHTLAAQCLSIIFQKNYTLVVLEQNIVLDLVSLGFHKVLSPTHHGHEVISTHDLQFRRALGICVSAWLNS